MSVAYLHRLDTATVVNVSLGLSEVRPTKSKSKTKPWDEKIKEITSVVCALFNSCHGGFLRLNFDEQCSAIKTTEPKTIDDMVRRIEQSVTSFAGIAVVSSAFKLQDTSTPELEFIVKPAPKFCTVEYNLYLPSDYQVSPITFGDCPAKIATLLQPHGKTFMVTFKEHCKNFTHKEKVPGGLRESQTVQFKLMKDEPTSNITLADRMTSKQNKLTAHVSAFANHDGGNLYFGVDDKTSTVQGQVANKKEQEKIRKRVSNVLSKMVWPDKSHQRFWSLEFVPVCERNGEVRQDTFVIVLSVAKCQGGVFVEEPESYQLENGKAVLVPLPLWKEKIRADARGCGDSSRCLHNSTAIVPTTCIYKSIGAKGWRKPIDEEEYMEFTQFMENLRNNGNWAEIDTIAARVLIPQNTNADLKLAVTFQCIAAAYRQNKYNDAYRCLASYQELVRQAKNPAIFEVQELYSWSAIKRSERDYQESYSTEPGKDDNEQSEKTVEEMIQDLKDEEAGDLKRKRRKVFAMKKQARERMQVGGGAAADGDDSELFSLNNIKSKKNLEKVDEGEVNQSSDDNEEEDSDIEDNGGDCGDSEDIEDDDEVNPLLVNPDKETDQATKTKLWFGKEMFQDLETIEDEDFEVEQMIKRHKKAGGVLLENDKDLKKTDKTTSKIATKDSDNETSDSECETSDSESATENSDYEMEPDEQIESNVTKKSQNGFEVVPQNHLMKNITPEGLALGVQMAFSKKRKREIEDDCYHRWTFNDDNLPEWFAQDEAKHYHRNLPVTKEETMEYRTKLREINARPIKKIAEAKARKKQKDMKRLERARKKAEVICDNDNVTDKEKAQQLRNLYKKIGKRKKPEVKYVVAKKGVGKRAKRPAGIKGPFKMVDPRMKKDLRGKKNNDTKRGKRK